MANILVVEDFEDSRFSLCRLLELSGHTTLEARNGLEAVRVATYSRPDLILMDVSLPDIDGITATEQIRAAGGPRMPIIVLSAHDAEQFHERAVTAGCDAYITKPVDFERLEALIRNYLG